MIKTLHTEIIINAGVEEIWEVLTNFRDFHKWNPFMRRARGVFGIGEKLEVTIYPPMSPRLTFHPVITKIEPFQEFRWIGHALHPKIIEGEHIFKLEECGPDSVKFIHQEFLTGWLTPLFLGPPKKSATMGFTRMNQALKETVEQK